jgi:CheY-like chemotaxis protein
MRRFRRQPGEKQAGLLRRLAGVHAGKYRGGCGPHARSPAGEVSGALGRYCVDAIDRPRPADAVEPSLAGNCALKASEERLSAATRSEPDASLPSPGRRVLVVEDNPDGLEALLALLELLGYATAGAGDGPAAIEAAARFRPAIVLLDLGLPGMDGYEVARALRAEPAQAGVVLVALTGWGAETDRVRTAEAGFDHHLTKPVDPDELESFLNTICMGLA